MRVALVNLDDGKYAIRRGRLFRQYYDFSCPGYWWSKSNCNFVKDCVRPLEDAMPVFRVLRNQEIVVET